jgi:excinuclease ABC subunit C
MKAEVEEKALRFPDMPGVYIMKDGDGKVIYVGKANSLCNRIRHYLSQPQNMDPKTRALLSEVADLDFIVTDSESEALLLECNLIKQYKPKYNVVLMDDKRYPVIKINPKEDFPRLEITRKIKRDGALYFGPYPSSQSIRQFLRSMRSIFPIRRCGIDIKEGVERKPCLDYHLGWCLAPCAGKTSKEAYMEVVRNLCRFLEGKSRGILKELKRKMKEAADDMRFEEAARIRDRIRALERMLERQRVVSDDMIDRDVIGLARMGSTLCALMLAIREGRVVGKRQWEIVAHMDSPPHEILTSIMEQHYSTASSFPREIIVGIHLPQAEELEAWLSGLAGRKVRISVPRRGERLDLLRMTEENAQIAVRDMVSRKAPPSIGPEAVELSEIIGLPKPPLRIEAFDISNIHGQVAVGSMVVFEGGRPKRSEYKRFRIKYVEGINDFAMIEEVIRRRFERKGEKGWERLPDLLLVDGGKGQLDAAISAMRGMGIEGIPAIGLAKRFEQIFVEGKPEPIELPKDSDALRLLQRIRDEAHRFAIEYHRKLRDKRTMESLLDKIPGIGKARKEALLKRFGSIEGIKRASVEEIASVPGISIDLARKVALYLGGHGQD